MKREQFERLVEQSLKSLPQKYLKELHNIAIVVEDEAPREVLDDLGIEDNGLYGLYQGTPLTDRGWGFGNALPDRIVIYQRPIEEDAGSDAEIEEMVRDTVMHEIGHYFGFSDETLYEIEDEKFHRRGKEGKKERG